MLTCFISDERKQTDLVSVSTVPTWTSGSVRRQFLLAHLMGSVELHLVVGAKGTGKQLLVQRTAWTHS